MSNEKNLLKQLEQFIGNAPTHVGYEKSFEDNGIFMPTEGLKEKMKQFSRDIQETVKQNSLQSDEVEKHHM